jgi:predicted CDP-diglyceride synthetase/phosphatidate cytidylyltransferase
MLINHLDFLCIEFVLFIQPNDVTDYILGAEYLSMIVTHVSPFEVVEGRGEYLFAKVCNP